MKNGFVRYLFPGLGILLVLGYAFVMLSGFRISEKRQITGEQRSNGYYLTYHFLERLGYKVEKLTHLDRFVYKKVIVFHESGMDLKVYRENLKTLRFMESNNQLILLGDFGEYYSSLGLSLRENDSPLEIKETGLARDLENFSFTPLRVFDLSGVKDVEVLADTSRGPGIFRKGQHIYFSDPRIFSNINMRNLDHARLLNNLLGLSFEETVFFYERPGEVHFGKVPVMVIFQGRLFFVTMHILLFAGLFLYFQGRRFGSPLAANLYSRRKVIEHIRAEGFFYRKARGALVVDKLDIRYFIYKLRKYLGEDYNRTSREVIEELTARFGLEVGNLEELLHSRRGLSDGELLRRRQMRNEIIKKIKG